MRVRKGQKDLNEVPAAPVQSPPGEPADRVILQVNLDRESNADTASLVLDSEDDNDVEAIPVLSVSDSEPEAIPPRSATSKMRWTSLKMKMKRRPMICWKRV